MGRAADACLLGHGRRGKLIRMACDLRGERRDKAIYFALTPAGEAFLGRDRPGDKRIRKRIRLTGPKGLLTVPGEDAGLLRGNAVPAQRRIMTPAAGSLPRNSRSAPGGPARPEHRLRLRAGEGDAGVTAGRRQAAPAGRPVPARRPPASRAGKPGRWRRLQGRMH